MNNQLTHSRLFASHHGAGGRGGGGGRPTSARQLPSHLSQQRPPLGASRQQKGHARSTSTSGGVGKEAMVVQKLQGALSVIRRERDQEFRNRNMAQEKLRSAQEAEQSARKTVKEETAKLSDSTNKTRQAIQDIREMEGSIAELQRKYDFKHEDLIRKRDKIMEYTLLAEKEGQQQEKTLDTTQELIEKQLSAHQTAEVSAARVTIFRVLSQVKAGNSSLLDAAALQQKRDEELLRRDLHALDGNSTMLILPQMINQKATSVDAETQLILAEISRLGNLLKNLKHEYEQKTLQQECHGAMRGEEDAAGSHSTTHEEVQQGHIEKPCASSTETLTKSAMYPTKNAEKYDTKSIRCPLQDSGKTVVQEAPSRHSEESAKPMQEEHFSTVGVPQQNSKPEEDEDLMVEGESTFDVAGKLPETTND